MAMAKRQSHRGPWLLLFYIALWKWPGCEPVASVMTETQMQSARKSSGGQVLIRETTTPIAQMQGSPVLHRKRDNAAKPSLYHRGSGSRKSLLKGPYGLFPLHPLATLFSLHGNNISADSSALPFRHDSQPPIPPQDHGVDLLPNVSAQQRIHTVGYTESQRDSPAVTRSNSNGQAIPTDSDVYDFIIVGCGAAGCPLASYLALKGDGRRILVLERGLERTFEQAPRAMTIFSDGVAIGDEAISQPYTTRKGIRTHVAAVMGGGTAIDLAIYVEETKEYFDYLNKRYPAYKFQWPAIQQAYRYVRRVVARKMPQDTRFAYAYGRALRARGLNPVGGKEPPEYSASIEVNKQWGSYSLFDVPQGGYRRAADVFLSELPNWAKRNVDVRTRHTVERIEFDETQHPPKAKCVVYRPTSYADIRPQGLSFGQTLPASSAGWGPWIGTFLAPQTVLVGSQAPTSTHKFFSQSRSVRRVCINEKAGSEIVLSAGAINTALLLYKSGIGPLQQLKEIGARVIVENPHVGQSFSDRVFIPVSAFMTSYADEVTPVPSRPVRRMAPRAAPRGGDKRTNSAAVPRIRRHGSPEGSGAGDGNNSTFLSRVSESVHSTVAGASVHSTFAFGAQGGGDTARRKEKQQRSTHNLADREMRGPDLHYRRSFSLARRSSPIAALSRKIAEEAHISVTSAVHQNSSTDTTVPNRQATVGEDFVTPNMNSSGEGRDPSRVVLADFKNSLSPEITGRFVDVRYPQEGLLSPPRVCQAMGLKQTGPSDGCSAEHYSIGKRTLTCSLFVAEETSGGRAQEGVVVATRFVFPPVLRNDPFVDVVFEILGACGDYKAPYGLPIFQPLCAIVMPVVKCFRKALATFHFIAEPKSRGSVHLRSDGAVEVEGNYLKDEQDLFDAVRGLSSLIEAMNGDAYRGIIQPAGSASCPATVLNGLLDLILTVGSTTTLFLTRKGNFALIQNYLQDLLPEKHRRLRRIIALDKDVKPRKLVATAVEEMEEPDTYYQEGEKEPNIFILDDYKESVIVDVDEKKLEELGYKGQLEKVGFDFDSFRRHLAEKSQPARTRNEGSSMWFAARRVRQEAHPSGEPTSADKRKAHQIGNATAQNEKTSSFTEQQLKEAVEACKKPCGATDRHDSCAAGDVCCAAFGNSLCIRTPENEALERQLRDELSNAFEQHPYGSKDDTDTRHGSPVGARAPADPPESCESGDESCVLRALPRDGLASTALEGMWGVMERLPAAGAALLKSFLPGSSPSGGPAGGPAANSGMDNSSLHPASPSAHPGSAQWAASFPPRLPDPYNPKEIARYALTYMSSVWHHCNTAPTGLVVNSDFEVIGTQRLSIVDASVINQITRMNPLATLLMMGIYAGMKKLQKLGIADVTPPEYLSGTPEAPSVEEFM